MNARWEGGGTIIMKEQMIYSNYIPMLPNYAGHRSSLTQMDNENNKKSHCPIFFS